jgi:hypothetical protein
MLTEIDKVFYNQFREARIYFNIVKELKADIRSLNDIAGKLKMTSSGGLKRYLTNLEQAEIIRAHIPWDKKTNSKTIKYSLSDEYLRFYFRYIEPNRRAIRDAKKPRRLFETLTKNSLQVWLGLAFERFCIKHADTLSLLMGFQEQVLYAGSVFEKHHRQFQIDLLYKRADNVITVCEIKFYNQEISTKIIPEMKKKLEKLTIPRGYSVETALISLYGPDKSLANSHFFDHTLTAEQILQ